MIHSTVCIQKYSTASSMTNISNGATNINSSSSMKSSSPNDTLSHSAPNASSESLGKFTTAATPSWSESATVLNNSTTEFYIPTSDLESKLHALREQSNKLSQELTQRLATSESGQNLMQIGPSLSTLPPDLHSLITCIKPLLHDVEEYVEANAVELERLEQYQLNIEACSARAQHARQCVALYEDLSAGERDVKRELLFMKKDSFSLVGDGGLDDGSGREDISGFLDSVSSLERAAHMSVYLLQELESSTAHLSAITSAPTAIMSTGTGSKPNNLDPKLRTNNNSPANESSSSEATVLSTTLPSTTEKAQFFSKLAPRILKLESDVIKCLISRLDSILTRMSHDSNNTRQPSSQQEKNANIAKRQKEDLLGIGHCLRGLALLGKGKEAESLFARVAIMPLLRSKVSIGRIDEGGSRGECAGLFSLLDDITYCITSNFGSVLRLSECIFGMADGATITDFAAQQQRNLDIDLVVAGVWIPIATTLMADPAIKMAIFSPGIASILQANFMALDTFISELAYRLLSSPYSEDEKKEELKYVESDSSDNLYFLADVCPAAIQEAQMRIYGHPTTVEFSKKWNLPIYYQLRFGECCTRLNRAIARVQREGWDAEVFTGSKSTESFLKENMHFEVPVFLELYDILLSLWKSDVFIRPLTSRFLRGSVQLLGRMIAFAKEGLEGNAAGVDSTTLPDSNKKDEDIIQFSWRDKAEDVAAVAWEMAVLEVCLTDHYRETVLAAVASKDVGQQSNVYNTEEELEELRNLISEVLYEASKDISPFISKCWMEVICGILTVKCCTPLAAVKGVAATYRMTNRPPPAQASHFVSTILRPLKEFDDVFSSRTPTEVKSIWKQNVVSIVSERYSIAVEELLETVRRTEEALKSRKARRTPGTVGMSDGDKVKLQLLLDFQEFSKGVAEVGIDGQTFEGLMKLKCLTEEAETMLAQIQNGVI